MSKLASITLAPYIQKATSLIGVPRKIGGNAYRHCFYVLGCLIDYHYIDPVILKAGIIHDLFEDYPDFDRNEILAIDEDGHRVLEIALELSHFKNLGTKEQYLSNLKTTSRECKIIKCADRISNLMDLSIAVFRDEKVKRIIDETIDFIIPLAEEVDKDMLKELLDLVESRGELLNFFEEKMKKINNMNQ